MTGVVKLSRPAAALLRRLALEIEGEAVIASVALRNHHEAQAEAALSRMLCRLREVVSDSQGGEGR